MIVNQVRRGSKGTSRKTREFITPKARERTVYEPKLEKAELIIDVQKKSIVLLLGIEENEDQGEENDKGSGKYLCAQNRCTGSLSVIRLYRAVRWYRREKSTKSNEAKSPRALSNAETRRSTSNTRLTSILWINHPGDCFLPVLLDEKTLFMFSYRTM